MSPVLALATRSDRSWTHTADLPAVDRAKRDGIPVTSLSRTILDLGVDSRPKTVARQIERADDLKVFDLREMRDLLDRTEGHRGRAQRFERRFLEVVREAGATGAGDEHLCRRA